jgi:hypothetical protein
MREQTRNHARFTIDLAIGEQPISGTISRADGDIHPFRGWLELTTKLEQIRTGAQPDPQPPVGNH